MHLPIIGGTQFVGRHLAEGTLARGLAVASFNRGKTPSHPPPAAQAVAQACSQAGLAPEREAAALAAWA